MRDLLQREAQGLGFTVESVATGLDAYRFALERRPAAILSDLRGPELDGRELLAAIRSDFSVRETPFIMVSSDYLAKQVASGGPAALGPIVAGLEAALAPRAALHERLARSEPEIGGWVEPIGISHLLRAIGRAGLSGRLQLSTKEGRGAVITFRRGAICGATVNAAQATVGPMAMLHLLGYEWQEFSLVAETVDGGQVPLGELEQLVETAFQQNNLLLTRVYHQGVLIEDVSVDSNALDLYLQKLPHGSLELLIRLVEGEKAAMLVERGVAAPGLLKSILHDLRRKAVIQPLSMRPVKSDERTATPAPAVQIPRRARRRWLVVVIACLVTVLLAGGGYFAFWYFVLSRRGTSAPAPKPAKRAVVNGGSARLALASRRPTSAASARPSRRPSPSWRSAGRP
jgi:CheY-like chemotaxis protein